MFKRYRFIFALMVCLCVFAYDTVSISDLRGKSFAWANEIAITEANFPDENFRTALLLATGQEATATDATITNAENIRTLTLTDGTITATMSEGESPFSTPAYDDKKTALQTAIEAITNISGITNFTELSVLNVSGCTALISLDVSGCTALTRFTVPDTISSINAEVCTSMTILDVSGYTNLKSLTVPETLTVLHASGCTGLTELQKLSECSDLTLLDVSGCTGLTSIDISALENLKTFVYSSNTKVTGSSLKIYAKQLILDGSINMTFYVEIDDATLNDSSITKTATFKIGNAGTFSGTLNKDIYMEADSKKYYAFIGAVTSVQMADPITVEIHVGDKTIRFDGYTVKDYLDTLTAEDSTYSEATKTLANALKDYGHYAQVTLSETNPNYNANDHTAMDANNNSLGTNVDDDLSAYAFKNETGSEEIGYILELDSNIVLHVILPSGSYVNDNASATENDTSLIILSSDRVYEMTDVTVWTDRVLRGESYEDLVYVSFSNIAAQELPDTFTIPVVISGTVSTIEVSPLSYVKDVLDFTEHPYLNEEKLAHWKQSLVALYNYYKATVAYRAELDTED